MFDYEVIASYFRWSLADLAQLPRRMRKHWVQIAARNMGLKLVKVPNKPELRVTG